MQNYIIAYPHEGEEFTITIPAKSFEDAEKRLTSLASGEVLGEVVMTIPLAPSSKALRSHFPSANL